MVAAMYYGSMEDDGIYFEISTCDATTIRLAKCVAISPNPKRCLSTCDQQRITSLETEHGVTIEISTCIGNPKFICQHLFVTILSLTFSLLLLV